MTCAGRAVAAVEGRGRRHGDGRDAAALGQVLQAAAVAQAPPARAEGTFTPFDPVELMNRNPVEFNPVLPHTHRVTMVVAQLGWADIKLGCFTLGFNLLLGNW